jgi:hypothetical protein
LLLLGGLGLRFEHLLARDLLFVLAVVIGVVLLVDFDEYVAFPLE